jgi:hypothetical protein
MTDLVNICPLTDAIYIFSKTIISSTKLCMNFYNNSGKARAPRTMFMVIISEV